MPEMYHPVTAATASVSKKDLPWYESNGWQDVTPFEFQDNSWAAVNPQPAEPAPAAKATPVPGSDEG